MPTLLIKDGFRFFFYSREGEYKPAHIHVEYQDGVAVFWLDPLALRETRGLSKREVDKAKRIILEYREVFLERYNDFFKGR